MCFAQRISPPIWATVNVTTVEEKEMLMEEARREGEEEGEKRGRKEGEQISENRNNVLINLLMEQSRYDDLKQAANDEKYKQQLFEEFEI